MRFKEKLYEYWHDLFYQIAPNKGVDLAMKCKDVTAKIDLGEVPTDFMGRFRFRLHIGLCKACRHYLNASAVLRNAIREMVTRDEHSINVELINKKLLEKYSKVPKEK